MIQEITGAVLKEMIINAAAAIEQNKQSINELNVFPVPDGDTGTNMSLTMKAGAAELRKQTPSTVGNAAEITANALLRGARGNSGVILSLLFRGMAKSLKNCNTIGTPEFAAAMNSGVTAAYKAVMKPTEGTILTVSRIASENATLLAETQADFEAFFEQVIACGNEALANTMYQNPVLQKAGVIDAGGKGYMCILDGMLKALRGEIMETDESEEAASAEKADFASFDTEDIKFMYCTEFIVHKENKKSPAVLRDYLSSIGDSIVMVDDDDIIKVHVHTNVPGNVLTQALTYGSLLTTKIENMKEQHSEKVINAKEQETEEAAAIAAPEKEYGFVAVCAGDGMAEIFHDLGADGIIAGGQTMNPSTEDILKQINKTPAKTVFVLPNNKNIIMAAEQCVQLTEKKVIVIPTKTVPQGISALLSMDLSLSEEECIALLNEAIQNTHTVQVTYAARDSDFDGHAIKAGEYLALLENKLLSNSAEFSSLLASITDALGQFSPEIITVFYGEDVDEETANETVAAITKALPNAETTLVYGGQPVYYYMISAE